MQLRLTESAQADIGHIYQWSLGRFGNDAAEHYLALIQAGIVDIARNPERAGSVLRPELGAGVRSWHLRLSRDRSDASAVRRPRHFVIYRVVDERLVIGRVLHDSMELSRHVDSDESWT